MPNNDLERTAQRIVVIGGAGYVGAVLTGQLLQRGYKVEVLDSLEFGSESLSAYEGHPGFRLRVGDIRNIGEVTATIQDADAVVLLAALVGAPACDRDPKTTIDVNLLATKAVAEACRYYRVPRMLFGSTDSVYGIQEGELVEDSPLNPISLYAELKAKVEAELLALADEDFHPTILRMATIYGLSPRMRFDLIINILARDAFAKGKITIFGGQQWRPLVHVVDAARAYVMALEAPLEAVTRQVFNVGSNEQNYRVGELGEHVLKVFPDVEIDTVPQAPDLRDYHVRFDKIADTLGYKVHRSVVDGIREMRRAFEDGTLRDHDHPRYYNVIPVGS